MICWMINQFLYHRIDKKRHQYTVWHKKHYIHYHYLILPLFLCLGKERDKETHPLASGAKSVCGKWELWISRGFDIALPLAPRSDSPRSISIFHKHFLYAPFGEMRDLVAGGKNHR